MSQNTTSAPDNPQHRIIISISSDFGLALANAWLSAGITVAGTYRKKTPEVESLEKRGAIVLPCDLSRKSDIKVAISTLRQVVPTWDVLVLAAGTQEPVGPFTENSFDDWEQSLYCNFTAQLNVVHGLLPNRRTNCAHSPMVLFFAGGGTNNATLNYSAYTIGKIASIKMVELLDAEIADTRFSILGPGWVKTKIHQATLDAGSKAGDNLERTRSMLASNRCVPMPDVVSCCEWLIDAPRNAVGGRNISLVYDCWGDSRLIEMLSADPDMYKLRRAGNGTLVRGVEKPPVPSSPDIIQRLVDALPAIADRHSPDEPLYAALAAAARPAIVDLFSSSQNKKVIFGPFGHISFPYRRMGSVDSLDLFGLDELIIFSFYWENKEHYQHVADIGANIGLHSLLLARCGYSVRSFEPDPRHLRILREVLTSNCVNDKVEILEGAVSDRAGNAEFIRVLGNTTGSHLAGAKPAPYGELDRFSVPLHNISDIMDWADLIKIDAEGHEKDILLATTATQWTDTDAIAEIGSKKNAEAVFAHFARMGIRMFSQKRNWQEAKSIDDVPTSYHEGSLFITSKSRMPWRQTRS